MVNRKTMSNLEIFNTASALVEAFQAEDKEMSFPVKVNFFLQKNMKAIVEMAQELEKSRIELVKKYSEPNEEGSESYQVAPDKIEEATQELQDLFNLEQEVPVNMLKLSWFEGVDMTSQQVAAIAYMIEEE